MATAILPPPLDSTSLISKKAPRARPLLDPPIVRRAIGDSFRKLHPRPMMKNPVMFVVEVGAVMTTVLAARDFAVGAVLNGHRRIGRYLVDGVVTLILQITGIQTRRGSRLNLRV